MSKVLVAYFSPTQTTRKVAQEIARLEEGDLFEIVPEQPYTPADLDWRDTTSRSTVEMNDPNARPAMVGRVENMEDYDTVFIGFPIWWGREPSVVDTFLDAHDLAGKIIIPFCTSGGSGMGNTSERINNLTGRKAKVLEGKRYGGTVSMEDLKIWMEDLGM
ncbi:MAG: NAD(P)H-dependent oxidoreductase [Lachnospiraceae bacterium]|nr:NAD(P)H-dependent oxidoreductase [Lachnospiraceae bacterium]